MRNLNLGDILLGLRNLSTDRKVDMLSCATGKLYAPKLAKQQAQIEALPEAQQAGRPLVQALATKDDEHDGFGEAIYHYVEAIQCLPSAPPAMKAAAKRVRETIVPKLSVLRASYADEAAAAARKQPLVDSLKSDLQTISVPHPANGTLLDWVNAFLAAGNDIDQLLNDRSQTHAEPISAPAIKIRTTTLGLLSRFRATLIDEIEGDPSLPRDLESRIFSYFDQLQAAREESAARRNKDKKSETPDNGQVAPPGNSGS